MPAEAREAVRVLFEVDSAMGDVVARSTEPALGRIKLAWWREQLEALDQSAPPAEPRLQAAAEQLLPKGISGVDIAGLEAGWATLLDEQLDPELVAQRGAILFRLAGRILGSGDSLLEEAGSLYALASVARRGVPDLFGTARERLPAIRGHRFERSSRPLTMLARAAARDLERSEAEGSRSRLLAMLAHRWSGRVG